MQDVSPRVATVQLGTLASVRRRISRLKVRFMVWFGLAILLMFGFLAIMADVVSPYDPFDQELGEILLGPSLSATPRSGRTYVFGSDDLGRDVLTRVFYGSRVSLGIGVAAVVIGSVTGTAAGLVARILLG